MMPLKRHNNKSNHQSLRANRGLSLIELMISLFLGLFITGVGYQVFIGAHTANKVINYLSTLQETGRFAIELIEKDLHRAGYFGGNANIDEITGSSGIVSTALTTCPATGTTWARMLEQHIYGLNDNRTAYDCITTADYLRGDILTLRYATPWLTTNYDAKEFYLRASLFEGRIFTGAQAANSQNINIAQTPQTVHQLRAHSYYIGTSAQTCNQSAIPALFRKTLVDGVPTSEELLTGVEQLQLEYGVDLSDDGIPNRYVDADNVADWNNVVVIKVALLVRSECADSKYTDAKTYQMGDVTYQPNDNFHRQLFSTSVTLRNLLNNT